MNDRTVGPKVDPPWWNFTRQVVVFGLGIFAILYATLTPGHDAAFLTTGLILIGFVPVENFLARRNGASKE